MKKLLLGLLVFGFTTQFMFSQIIELPDVHLDVNYKYLNAIDSEDVEVAVKMLEEEVAFYDVKESPFYDDNIDTYRVSFFIPKGKIVAAYDEDGKILRTFERFENVALPRFVIASVAEQYPKWKIEDDTYKVNYYGKTGIAKKQYKVKLQKGNKKMIVKLDEDGDFL